MASLESMEKYLKSLKVNINALKSYIMYALGSVMMIGAAPEYLGVWLMWRGATLVLPNWVYQWGDDKLYSLYQRLVLFFFETCTRTQVVVYGDADALKKKESVLYLANHQSTAYRPWFMRYSSSKHVAAEAVYWDKHKHDCNACESEAVHIRSSWSRLPILFCGICR
ncbi:1-acyl-sn-glycerol-3-phosphate acyltransferase epsilon-like isoform X2 [Homarus americanus]|uniref:1-acyl-sn-glycerol-3-phosphate acyltransferase epsilon-like isoform X2 n=1 Tax=Homarus americanus TaxID=6706 RepID=UPI001C492272|nr:1-acyl-sn-glycerol-3-phosphate acyltransferase epsilon-like isoform X2 [Homarus americanus]